MRNFYIRLQACYNALVLQKPLHEHLFKSEFAHRLLECLPLAFQFILSAAEKAEPLTILYKAYDYARAHPSCKMTDEEVAKEVRVTVNAVPSLHGGD